MICHRPEQWDEAHDVVVVGSGAAGLVAATIAADGGADVALLERSPVVGGTTGVSGGGIWVPGNHHMAAAGIEDDRQAALTYIQHVAGGTEPDPALVEAFVDVAPRVLVHLESKTPLRTAMVQVGDYYLSYGIPGAARYGRQVEPLPFPFGTELPEWGDRVAERVALPGLGGRTTMTEDVSGAAAQMAEELERRARADVRTKGAALVGMLLRGILDRGVVVRRSTRARETVVADGRVVGLRAERDGRSALIGAHRGVVLACGGFEWDPDLVRAFIGYEVQPLSPPGNEGDGLRMAVGAGGGLANMTGYWGHGAMVDPAIGPAATFDAGRGVPGTMVVNGRGERFVNENAPYHDFAKSFGRDAAAGPDCSNRPRAWLLFDEAVRQSVPILSIQPGVAVPGWVDSATTLEGLAARIGLQGPTFTATVARFNHDAARAMDTAFSRHQRGLVVAVPPRPLGPGPFYALPIYPGALGTSGGPLVDLHGRVLDWERRPVPGLFGAGNTVASIFGGSYPSGGATLGHAMVTGYLAGRRVAEEVGEDVRAVGRRSR